MFLFEFKTWVESRGHPSTFLEEAGPLRLPSQVSWSSGY